mmetsp:Transcript_15930/g.24617  ORF Transcript_15930/g.24617 Transcript_15930/m.24617 type:complete len:98 (-) Transcript_15930:3629-3922(-)
MSQLKKKPSPAQAEFHNPEMINIRTQQVKDDIRSTPRTKHHQNHHHKHKSDYSHSYWGMSSHLHQQQKQQKKIEREALKEKLKKIAIFTSPDEQRKM